MLFGPDLCPSKWIDSGSCLKEASPSISQFLSEIVQMPRVNTQDFEALYELRKDIERMTMEARKLQTVDKPTDPSCLSRP